MDIYELPDEVVAMMLEDTSNAKKEVVWELTTPWADYTEV